MTTKKQTPEEYVKNLGKQYGVTKERVRQILKEESLPTKAVGTSDVAAISVGKNALPAIANVVAKGLLERESYSPGRILDIPGWQLSVSLYIGLISLRGSVICQL